MAAKYTTPMLAAALLALACSGDATAPPANRAPVASGEIPAQRLAGPGDTLSVDLSGYFNDPDGDSLTFEASRSAPAVVRVDVAGTVASLTARAVGESAVTVTARDPDGLEARAVFAAEVVEHPDRAALVALYNATDGANWRRDDNWLTDAPLADWYQVDVRDGRVYYLSLYDNGLTGPIPPELGNLASLQYLFLSGNKGLCAPDDSRLRALLANTAVTVFPCLNSAVRPLPSALMRADGNGPSVWLPDDLRAYAPAAVNVSDPAVVFASVLDGRLELVPRSPGAADVELVPGGGGRPPAVAAVVVREGVGTFGIDIVVLQPAPVGYAEAMTAAADWWSSALDGTEWTDRTLDWPRDSCSLGGVTATVDELLIVAKNRVEDPYPQYAALAWPCPLLDSQPVGGSVELHSGSAHSVDLMRHENGHLLGLVDVHRIEGLTTGDEYFIGPRTVEAYRTGGGDPDVPGPTIRSNHWAFLGGGCELMSSTGCREGEAMDGLSLAALADMGYTVDMTKATPWRKQGNAAVAVGKRFRDVVTVRTGPGVPRR